MKCVKEEFLKKDKRKILRATSTGLFLIIVSTTYSQDGTTGINQATPMVKSYFDAGANLMYAIGALLGLIGGVKVYQKWNHGDHDTGKVAAAWFGSCIFLVIVATVIKSFFGL